MTTHSGLDEIVGTTLSATYAIQRVIGEGGMGTVYEALHLRLNKRVAVKVMAHALASNSEALARFRREAEVTSDLGYPHIVQVIDFATAATGEPFFVMEYLDGEDLEHRMQRLGRLPCLATLHIVKQVAVALAAAHSKGVVHRDLKPANIFLLDVPGEPDFVKVLDFGVSKVHAAATKLTGASRLMGTPKYMSREQAQGLTEEVDDRTDQWALACIAWEALGGRAPFFAEDDLSLLYQVVYEAPAPLSSKALSPQVDRVLRRALAKNRRDRFSSITDFSRAFERALVGPPSDATTAKDRHTFTLLGSWPRPLPTLRLASSTPSPASRTSRKPRKVSTCVRTPSERAVARKRNRGKWFWPIVALATASALAGTAPLLQAVPAARGERSTTNASARPPVLLPEAVTATPPAPPDASSALSASAQDNLPTSKRFDTVEKFATEPAPLPEVASEHLRRPQRSNRPPTSGAARRPPFESSRETARKATPGKTSGFSEHKRLIREL